MTAKTPLDTVSTDRVVVLSVNAEARGQRLDKFVAEALALRAQAAGEGAPTRAEVQRWIDAGRVTLAGKTRSASDKVRAGDTYAVHPMQAPTTDARPQPEIPLRIVHQDEDVVVVFKPAGLVVHPAAGHADGTLVNALLGRGFFQREMVEATEDEHVRPGIVHRLDKDTSGLLVVARNAAAREHLKVQFAGHTIGREYVAIAAGNIATQTFSTLHGRHPSDRMRFTAKVREGKRAVTHVSVLEALGPVTYLCCRLETGRTHQIRMHLSEAGAPILGDSLYRFRTSDSDVRAIADQLGHQALHARHLAFEHPRTGKRLAFTAEPDADFMQALGRLRTLFSGNATRTAR